MIISKDSIKNQFRKIETISEKNKLTVVIVLVLMMGGLYITTLQNDHNWGGDFGMYIHHAKNLVEGLNYKDVGFIYNPEYHDFSPMSWPPVFPLLIMPIYFLFGLNLIAIKILITVFFLALLLLLYFIFKQNLNWIYALLAISLVGFHPYFLQFKENILSDIPFTFFTFLSLFYVNKFYTNKNKKNNLHVLAIALLLYLAIGTRSVGLILLFCLVIFDIVKNKKISYSTFKIITITSGLFIIQSIIFYNSNVHLKLFTLNIDIVRQNIILYSNLIFNFWFQKSGLLFILGNTLFCSFAFFGFVKRIIKKISILEIFLLSYLITLIFYNGFQGLRYLIPVLPLFAYYFVVGLVNVWNNKYLIQKIILLVLLIILVFIFNIKINLSIIRRGINKVEAVEVFKFIKNNTPPDAIFIFKKPRVLSLYTDRQAAIYQTTENEKSLINFICQIKATYILYSPIFTIDQIYLKPFIEKNKDKFQATYSNSDFELYEIINKEDYCNE
jgi:4-amino-4-deoxy-L-arabinose transferase-like glycosyltransferase